MAPHIFEAGLRVNTEIDQQVMDTVALPWIKQGTWDTEVQKTANSVTGVGDRFAFFASCECDKHEILRHDSNNSKYMFS